MYFFVYLYQSVKNFVKFCNGITISCISLYIYIKVYHKYLLGHSKGANDALLYASKYDDTPFVISISARFDMSRGLKDRFGDDIL